jgi:Domain of unknown function (DUF4258)
MAERNIDEEWVSRTLTNPVLTQPDLQDPQCSCAYSVISECGGRVLKVVYANQHPLRVITAYFDRGMRGRL